MNETNYPDSTSNVPWPTSDNQMRLPDPSPDSDKTASAALGLVNHTVHANAAQLRETRDQWVEGARCTVRSNPLVSVAAAFMLGLLFARITR